MKLTLPFLNTRIGSVIRSDRSKTAFVWSLWLLMLTAALVVMARYGRNFPMYEDWLLVAPLTGNEPDLPGWVWAQNSEHRNPLTRLIFLGLLKIAQGDFRVGMFFNIITLGVLSAAMIAVARHLRDGRTRSADAFFPLVLLHLGHWENLIWSWPITFVLPTALICALLLAIISNKTLTKPGTALFTGISLLLLSLCGVNGLVFAPFLALWTGYGGILHWYSVKKVGGRQWIGSFLIGSSAVAICLTGLYFVGYERPTWAPPNPGVGPTLETTIRFMALGFGPVARSSWTLATVAVIVLLFSAGALVIRALRKRGLEERRALGVLVFLGSTAAFALALGWGRAGVILDDDGYWAIRYALLAVPALCAAYFAWELYGPARIRTVVLSALFGTMLLLIPLNTAHGREWGRWYQEGLVALERDIAAGTPFSTLAERHRDFLIHFWDIATLEEHMRMLYDAQLGPFAQVAEDPPQAVALASEVRSTEAQVLVTQGIQYYMPEAGEVFLVWGINGWQTVPEEIRPAGTELTNNIMHTPMSQEGGNFILSIQVPFAASVEYGFLITKDWRGKSIEAIWEGSEEYQAIALGDDIIKVRTLLTEQTPLRVEVDSLVTQEIQYHLPEAGEVFLVWGINGWQTLPEEIRPAGTHIKNNTMRIPMVRKGNSFVAQIRVPKDTHVEYGFLITERRGLFDVRRPLWDGSNRYQMTASTDKVVVVESSLNLNEEISFVFQKWPFFLLGVVTLLGTWCSIFAVISHKKTTVPHGAASAASDDAQGSPEGGTGWA